VIIVLPPRVAITISGVPAATEAKAPALPLRMRQISSTKGESAGLTSSDTDPKLPPPTTAESPDRPMPLEHGGLSPLGPALSPRSGVHRARHAARAPNLDGLCRGAPTGPGLREAFDLFGDNGGEEVLVDTPTAGRQEL